MNNVEKLEKVLNDMEKIPVTLDHIFYHNAIEVILKEIIQLRKEIQ